MPKVGQIKVEIAIIDGVLYQDALIGGIEVSGIDEIVINRSVKFLKVFSEDSWVRSKKDEPTMTIHETFTHSAMMQRLHKLLLNRKRFHSWVSGSTINICDRKLL